jgi:hypothetical protein
LELADEVTVGSASSMHEPGRFVEEKFMRAWFAGRVAS